MFKKIRSALRKEPQQLHLKEVVLFLEKTHARELDAYYRNVEQSGRQITEAVADVRDLVAKTRSEQAPTPYAEAVKNRFCDRVIEGLEKVRVPQRTRASVLSFIHTVSDAMQLLNSLDVQEFKQLYAYKERMSIVAAKTKIVEVKLEDIQKQEIEEKVKQFFEIVELVKGLEEKNKTISVLTQDVENIEKSLPFLVGEREKNEREIEHLKMRMEEFQELDAEIGRTQSAQESVSQQLDAMCAGLDKMLRLYVHASGKQELQEYALHPKETFLNESENIFFTLLREMQASIEAQRIEFDDKRKEKLQSIVTQEDQLRELKNTYQQSVQRIKTLQEELQAKKNPLHRAVKNEEETKESLDRQIEQLKERREKKLEQQAQIQRALQTGTEELQQQIGTLLKKPVTLGL